MTRYLTVFGFPLFLAVLTSSLLAAEPYVRSEVRQASLQFDQPAIDALSAASPELDRMLGLGDSDGLINLGPFGGGVTKLEEQGPRDVYSFDGMVDETDGVVTLNVELLGDIEIARISAEFQRREDMIDGDIVHYDATGRIIDEVSWTSNSPRHH